MPEAAWQKISLDKLQNHDQGHFTLLYTSEPVLEYRNISGHFTLLYTSEPVLEYRNISELTLFPASAV